jgi:hypothetical protein
MQPVVNAVSLEVALPNLLRQSILGNHSRIGCLPLLVTGDEKNDDS